MDLYAAPHTTTATDSYCLQYVKNKNYDSNLVQHWLCVREGYNYFMRFKKGLGKDCRHLNRQEDVAALVEINVLQAD